MVRSRNYFEWSTIWVQSRFCSSKRLEMRAILRWHPFSENGEIIELNQFWWAWLSTQEERHCLRRLSLTLWIFFMYWQSVPQSPDPTSVENLLPFIKHLEKKGRIISIERSRKGCAKLLVTCLRKFMFKLCKKFLRQRPIGSCHSLNRTSDEILKRRNPHISWYLMNKWI